MAVLWIVSVGLPCQLHIANPGTSLAPEIQDKRLSVISAGDRQEPRNLLGAPEHTIEVAFTADIACLGNRHREGTGTATGRRHCTRTLSVGDPEPNGEAAR